MVISSLRVLCFYLFVNEMNKRCVWSYLLNGNEYILLTLIQHFLPVLHLSIIEHFLLLILGKLKYANQRQSYIESYRLPKYFITNIDSLKECINAVANVH